MTDFWKNKKVVVTGGAGFLGSRVVEKIQTKSPGEIVIPRSAHYDLRNLDACKKIVKDADIVIHLAAKAGGIGFNQKYPGELFFDNIMMGVQLMDEARKAGVDKFVSFGTVCEYPKLTPVPFKEEDLWNGYPEETNAAYGLAKKMGLVQAQAYRQQYGLNAIHLMPVNLYGPGDPGFFDPEQSHVMPDMIRKFLNAKERGDIFVSLWGTGKASREFLYIDEAAEAIVLATEKYDKPEPVNIGSSFEITIKDLAETIKKITGFEGEIVWDTTKPDGQPRRKLDVSRAKKEFGFVSKTSFEEGLQKTLDWYLKNR